MQAFNKQVSQTPSIENNSPSNTWSSTLLIPQVVTASLEILINKALQLNTKSINFGSLSHKVLTLKLAELSFPLSFTVNNNGVVPEVIVRSKADDSDCVICTSINTLKKLKAQESLTQLIKDDQLDVIGDITVAQQFSTVVQSIDIDWQTELANHLGDIPTHNLLYFGNKITESLTNTHKKFQADVGEYVVHEKRLVVTSSQLIAFNDNVNKVANCVDKLSIRINKLVAKCSDS